MVISGDVYKENWNVTHQPQVFFYLKGVIHQLLQKNCPILTEEQSTDNDIFSEGLNYKYKGKSLLQFGFIKKEICDKFDINQEVLYAELDFIQIADLAKNNNIQYQCIKSMAELEKNIDGSKSIKKLILE